MAHSIDIREEAGVRYLHFGTDWVQGAMRLAKPNHLVLAYTQEMLSFLLFREVPRRVLMIGLGAARWSASSGTGFPTRTARSSRSIPA